MYVYMSTNVCKEVKVLVTEQKNEEYNYKKDKLIGFEQRTSDNL